MEVEQTQQQPTGNHRTAMQIIRSLLVLTWFNCCCVCILATQLVGSPLYFINRDYFNAYMVKTKESFGIAITAMTQWNTPTPVRVSGDNSVRGQLGLTQDGRLKTGFPERLILIANHQVYTDWLYLWWISYTARMHGHIYIVLKESLKYIPLLGQGMMFYGFIFMSRKWVSDKPRLHHRLEKLKTKRTEPVPGTRLFNPMWLLIFPEGTNLSRNTKRISDAYGEKHDIRPFKHQLLPRSTGLFFCLQQLKGTVDWVYDCTVGYEGPPKGSYPDAYFTIRSTYLRGRPPRSVNFYWRRFAISEIPLNDQKEFEIWLNKRWAEKDQLLEQFVETGRFPPCEWRPISNSDTPEGGNPATADTSYIETEVRLTHWIDVWRIFIVLFCLALLIQQAPKFWNPFP